MYSHINVLFVLSGLCVPIAWNNVFWWLCVYYVPIRIVTNWKCDVRDLVVYCVCLWILCIVSFDCTIRYGHGFHNSMVPFQFNC
jgi:hypothetical protein